MELVSIGVSHKTADLSVIEALTFRDQKRALHNIFSLESIVECILLQTCNRVQIFAATLDKEGTTKALVNFLLKKAGVKAQDVEKALEIKTDDAISHLFRLASGLESMIVGEDQILGQIKDALKQAEEAKTVGIFLRAIFTKAIIIGKKVRQVTEINKGAVSIGSAAVELAENFVGDLTSKNVLLIGAGEMATLVAKSLSEYKLAGIFVANRTYERGVKLAEELGGQAVKFEMVDDIMANSDIVISATAAPHVLITVDKARKILEKRKRPSQLLIIDIATPRDVDKEVGSLSGIKLFDIDGLREIAEENKRKREGEIHKVERIIAEDLKIFNKQLVRLHQAAPFLSALLSKAEETRMKELEKALRMLGSPTEREKQIICDLTRVLSNRLLLGVINNLKMAADNGDIELIEYAAKLFDIDTKGGKLVEILRYRAGKGSGKSSH